MIRYRTYVSKGKTRMIRIYRVWRGMIHRCHGKPREDHKYYGGRGISVCQEWLNDFFAFRDWAISSGYRKGLTIERINNDGNYEPSNCKWIPRNEQPKNQSHTKKMTLNGITRTQSEWAAHIGIDVATLLWRLRNWSFERALTEKPHWREHD